MNKSLVVTHVRASDEVADALTKSLSKMTSGNKPRVPSSS